MNWFVEIGYVAPVTDSVDYSGDDGRICNMKGNAWEQLPCPIIIDGGAAASVMPIIWCARGCARD